MIYLAAFFGGMLLNLMPCVLPVLGLKLSKPSPHFVLGLLTVFAALATLSTTLGLTWGSQFNYPWFNAAMAGVVFAFALSLFGLWEMPARYSGSSKMGPFMKGILSTLLATPCSGPLLGSVFAFTLGQPSWVVYSVFMTVGLGMSTPYILAMMFRVPLPKPGAWMENLKVACGFLLMGTVIWLLTGVAERLLFPALVMLLLIGFVCWTRRWWLVPIIALPFLVIPSETLPWRPYSHAAFAEYEFDGRPMLIDFTAKLCLTCKTNEAFVLNTAAVKRAVERHGVVPLVADVADPECAEKLQALGYNSVPVIVIVKDGKVTILPDLVSKQQVLDALD